MRTAQQVYNHILQESPSEAAWLIKKYAEQVAHQALIDASDNLTDCHSSLSAWESNKAEILETEIKLP